MPERLECVAAALEAPPSAALPFYQVDAGQSGPRFVRSTTTMAPAEQKLQTDGVPFGILVQPLAEMSQAELGNAEECFNGEVPCTDFSTPV